MPTRPRPSIARHARRHNWLWLPVLAVATALAAAARGAAARLLLALPAAAAPLAGSLETRPAWLRRPIHRRRLCALSAKVEEKRIADDGIPYTKQEFIEWYSGSTAEWDRAKPYIPEPPPVPVTKKQEFTQDSAHTIIMRFTLNASVGVFVRPIYVPEVGLVLCVGDWSGRVSGVDPATGAARFTAADSGLGSLHSLTYAPKVGLMVCSSAWTGNVSAFEPLTGERQWTADVGVGGYARSVYAQRAGLVVFAGGGAKPVVAAVDPATGEAQYNINLSVGAVWSLTYLPKTGNVLCGASWTRPKKTGRLCCLEPASGRILYDVDPEVGRYVCATSALEGELVLCAGDLGLVAGLEPATGEVRFRANASVGEVWALEDTPGSTLCIGGWTGLVSGVDPASGDVRFTVNTTIGKIFSSVYVPELGVALLGNNNGTVAGLDPSSGEIKFKMDAALHDPGPWDPIKSNPWKNELWCLAYVPEAKLIYCGGDTNSTVRVLAA